MLGWGGDRDKKFLRVGRWNFGWGSLVRVLWVRRPRLTLSAASVMDFPAAGLVAAVDLRSGFLGLVVFLVKVTLGCLRASVTGGEGLGSGFGGGVVVTLTRPLGRDSTLRPARRAFGAAGSPVAALFRTRFGASFAKAALVFFPLIQPL